MRIKFIFLDLRYFKSRATLLGEEQWIWLEDTLRRGESDITFIVSSLNVLGEWTLSNIFREGWHRYPLEQNRLFSLVSELNGPVVFLSGDRHYSERGFRRVGPQGKTLWEYMSSGLNKPGNPIPNRFRIGSPVSVDNYATIEIYKEKKTQRLKILHLIKSSRDGSVISRLDSFIQ